METEVLEPNKNIFKEASVAILLTSTVAFFLGWMYIKTYYETFGIDHLSLNLPLQHYFITPWSVYSIMLTVILYAVKTLIKKKKTAEKKIFSSKWHKLISLIKVILSSGLFFCALVLIHGYLFEERQNKELFNAMYSVVGACIVVILVNQFLQLFTETDKQVSVSILIKIIFIFLVLLGITGFNITQARKAAHQHSSVSDQNLPLIRMIFKNPNQDKELNTSKLKILFAAQNSVYAFKPLEENSNRMPDVICTRYEEISYYLIESQSLTYKASEK